ncbi:MAG: polysaccharide deacetylase family protein [Bacteroidetes bacterium]|nr:polysaccharide deacetylase family protein [Bacteroidota bacterium]
MLLIYTHKLTSRNQYTFKLIFGDILGWRFRVTTSTEEFSNYDGPKFTYCRCAIEDELFFCAREFLFETGIVVQEPGNIRWNGNKVLFPVARKSALPFDPFAATFLLVSRYEEYLPHLKDQHGRFTPSQSLAFQYGFLQKPVVNHWALEIKKIVEARFGKLQAREKKYSFIPTIDIDNAWAFRHKGFIRIGGGMISDLAGFNLTGFKERFKSVFRMAEDPYDTYDYQVKLFDRYGIEPMYFILLGDYATYDKNVPYQNKHMQSLIKFMGDLGQVGIHPSYASNEDKSRLRREIMRLSGILHQEIHLSRQHFLKLSIPETYQTLIEHDITDDFTMGYADLPGFRASICSPFFFYDLDLEIETSLKLHPFAIMDGTLKDYMNIAPEQAMEVIYPLIDEVKSVQGEFISVWHNESFAENERWKGWRTVYEQHIEAALP